MRTKWAGLAGAAMLVLAACSGSPGQTGASGTPATTVTTSTTSTTIPTPTTTSRATPTAPSTTRTPSATRTTAPPAPPAPTRTPTSTPRTTAPRVPIPTTTPSSPALPAALRGAVVTRIPTSARVVALTFDAGAGSQGAASILATLRAQGVPASFFATGRFASTNPSTTRQMASLGPVGNHTWSHPDLTTLSRAALDRELSSTRSAILAATGRDPRPLFRFPFGACDARVLAAVHTDGYGAVGWTTDSLGWKGTSGGMTVDKVVTRVLAGAEPGQIILMHVGANPDDGTTLDAAALPRIIAGLRSRGYGFTTLAVLLR